MQYFMDSKNKLKEGNKKGLTTKVSILHQIFISNEELYFNVYYEGTAYKPITTENLYRMDKLNLHI